MQSRNTFTQYIWLHKNTPKVGKGVLYVYENAFSWTMKETKTISIGTYKKSHTVISKTPLESHKKVTTLRYLFFAIILLRIE